MKRLSVAVLTIGAAIAAFSQQAPVNTSDPELKAMRDEMTGSREMSLNELGAPYFIQYLIDESSNFAVSASVGGVVSQRLEAVRELEVRVRVGDDALDNTNYTGAG